MSKTQRKPSTSEHIKFNKSSQFSQNAQHHITYFLHIWTYMHWLSANIHYVYSRRRSTACALLRCNKSAPHKCTTRITTDWRRLLLINYKFIAHTNATISHVRKTSIFRPNGCSAQCSRGANKANTNAHTTKKEFQNKPFQVQRVNLANVEFWRIYIWCTQTEPAVHFILNLTILWLVSTKRRSMSILISSNKICSANSSHDRDHVSTNGSVLKNFTVITLLHR